MIRNISLLIVFTFLSSYIVSGNWTNYRGNQMLHGSTSDKIPSGVNLKWTFETDGEITASPVIKNEKIIIGSTDGFVYCLNIQGTLLWKFDTGSAVEASALILDNKVFVGNLQGSFYAVSLDTGEKVWKYKSRNQINATANWWSNGDKKYVLFGDYDYYLNCLDAKTGELVWQYEANNFIHATVAVENHFAVFGGCDGHIHIIDIRNGKLLSTLELATYIAGSPALMRGHAFIGDYDGVFTCVNYLENKVLWRFNSPDKDVAIIGSPSIQNFRVLFGSRDRNVYCLNIFTGKKIWKRNTGARIDASILTDKNSALVANMRGDLMRLNLFTGEIEWTYEVGSPIAGTPAVYKGNIILGATDGLIYFLEP